MLTASERDALVATILHLPAQLHALVDRLNLEQLNTAYLANEWTIAQNIHHLADTHMTLFIRMKLLLLEEHPTLKPFDQDTWVTTADSIGPIEPSLLILQGLQERAATLVNSLDLASFDRTGWHPENGEMTLEQIARYYARHGELHLEQISQTLAAAN
ncbi:DinB family protein [Herpetosiphon llansteffanensis]|uniref:DinB family protein n=1 Tax=Herpetosiphon llansteffanensis TaxID=2094568 RepID=UPI000D7BF48C|nr:DinB family protein [Herpetosiphon llansteffanensis]